MVLVFSGFIAYYLQWAKGQNRGLSFSYKSGIDRNYWTKCEPFLSKILTNLCVAEGDAHPPTTQKRRAGKNSFPQTPFLFARPHCPLRGRADDFIFS
jgi:hypothetical protein